MTLKEQLELLEQKVELIMKHLGLSIDQPVESVEEKIDTSHLELALQKTLNEIKVLKIKFRTLSPKSPVRQETLDKLEELTQTKKHLEADLDAIR